MTIGAPKFYDSPYFVDEPGNWHLKPGAPKDVVEEFNEFMKTLNAVDEKPKSKEDTIEEV